MLSTTIYANEKKIEVAEFEASGARKNICIPLDNPSINNKISFRSSNFFIPARIGRGPDTRHLSVVLENLSAKPLYPESRDFIDLAEKISSASVIHGNHNNLNKAADETGEQQLLLLNPPIALNLEIPVSKHGELSFQVSLYKNEDFCASPPILGIKVDDFVLIQALITNRQWQLFTIPVPETNNPNHIIILEAAPGDNQSNCTLAFKNFIFK